MVCSTLSGLDCCVRTQDPAGFLRWLHERLHEQDPSGVPAPPNVTVEETEITARTNLLHAMQIDGFAPRAYAITIDGAGYLVSIPNILCTSQKPILIDESLKLLGTLL